MTQTSPRFGFIGLGAMGKPMARHIASRRGIPVNIHDKRPEAVADSNAWGGVAMPSSAAVAAASDVVFTMVPADQDLLDVALGRDGLIAGMHDGLTLIDFGTIGPKTVRDVDSALRAKGGRCLAAAVTLGVAAAQTGTLTVYVDSEAADEPALRALIEGCAARVIPTGGPGSAKVMKIVNNMLTGSNVAIVSEVLTLGVKAGIPAEKLIPLLMKGSGRSYVLELMFGGSVMQGDLGPGNFSIDYMIKDLKLAQELARQHGHSAFFPALAIAAYQGARGHGHADDYVPALVRWWEQASNMPPIGPTTKVAS
jgi:2-hydroxy-3-oxopropionate reductase